MRRTKGHRRHLTAEQRSKRSDALLKFWASSRGKRQKTRYSIMTSAQWTPKARARQSVSHVEFWENMSDDEYEERCDRMKTAAIGYQHKRRRTLRRKYRSDPFYGADRLAASLAGREMSLPEEQVRDILYLLELPYEFVGDGKLMIGRFCPDFCRADAKAVIDVFGSQHSKKSGKMKMLVADKRRIEFIKEQGYSILVLWQDELKHIKETADKIIQFDEKILRKILKVKPKSEMARQPLISVKPDR